MRKLMITAAMLIIFSGSAMAGLVDNEDGTVTDTATGLMWQTCSYGQEWDEIDKVCTGSAVTLSWQQALEAAEALTWSGHSDWRLPNINELQTLVDDKTLNPAIDTNFFPNTRSSPYWSSTTAAYRTDYAWRVDFYYGPVHHRDKSDSDHNYVRAVRAGLSEIISFGDLVISIEPSEAADSGAQWRIAGTQTWYDSGEPIQNVPVGTHIVEFKTVPGWRPAENIQVEVVEGVVSGYTGYYQQYAMALPGVLMLLLDDGKALQSGKWTGSSEFGRLEFILNPDSTAITKIKYEFSNFTCGPSTISGTISVSRDPGWPVSEGGFTIENILDRPQDNMKMIIEGAFDDTGQQASGTWTAVFHGTTCTGSWEASFSE